MTLRFSLATLLVLIALISMPMGWIASQLHWIQQRHQFLEQGHRFHIEPPPWTTTEAPWSLRLFGEQGEPHLIVATDDLPTAIRLFPESDIFTLDWPYGIHADEPPTATYARTPVASKPQQWHPKPSLTAQEIVAFCGPASVAAMLGVLWIVRRFRTRSIQ